MQKKHINSEGKRPVWMASKLSKSGCLSLGQILNSFSNPISEEQAWAVTYEVIKTLDACLAFKAVTGESPDAQSYFEVQSPSEIIIHWDGRVDEDTFIEKNNSARNANSNRTPISNENKAVSEIGHVIFASLDFGLENDQERQLSEEMERLLDIMTAANSNDNNPENVADHEDEGIEQDHDPDVFRRTLTCKKVLQECEERLSKRSEAESHYKAVCRALVSESLELTSFMSKIKSLDAPDASELIKEMAVQDWARLWVQVLRDMRAGVKLKKVQPTKTPVEYELTPFEILMDDIRHRRYTLNKVPTEERTTNPAQKDAHDIILEFIRSRPPLRPASERKLRPHRKESTPVELLMEDIRNSKARSSLRKTGGPPPRAALMRLGSSSSTVESSRTKIVDDDRTGSDSNRPLSPRRKVTVDPSTISNLLNFSDSEGDYDLSDEENDNPVSQRRRISVATLLSRQTSVESTSTLDDDYICYVRKQEQNEMSDGMKESKRSWRKQMTRDLALHGNAPSRSTRSRSRHQRRNSVTVCETPSAPLKRTIDRLTTTDQAKSKKCSKSESQGKFQSPKKILITANPSFSSQTSTSLASSSSSSIASSSRCNTPTQVETEKIEMEDSGDEDLINKPQMHANLHAEFMQSEHWATALQTLDLTLDEVVHIRSVLTKAELEGLPLDGTLKEDVEKGKVCFLCMKSRFGFFNRGNKCELCKQQICNKCSLKMKIPLEHFATTPVFTLRPQEQQTTSEVDGGVSSKPFKWKKNSSTFGVFGVKTVGSAPTSPIVSRKFSPVPSESGPTSCFESIAFQQSQLMASSLTSFAETEDEYGDEYSCKSLVNPTTHSQQSQPSSISYFKRSSKTRSISVRERLEGRLQTICFDCKEMVLQVIRAQTTARRLQMAKSFFQNLSTTQ